MKIEELLSKLILDKISVFQALMLTKLYYSKQLSEESIQWITNESEGYGSNDVPKYRLLDCSLKLEVYDAFSNRHIETLDTSHINSYLKEGGYEDSSPNKMRISQSIESIEKIKRDDSGNIRMFLDENVKAMVLEWYKHPQYIGFGRLYQECPYDYVNVIKSKVKNSLINILQKELNANQTLTDSKKNKKHKKKIFISYSWDDEEHKKWVYKLAQRLNVEFDVLIDVKQPLGTEINVFMEKMVSESDRVLLILTPQYKQKADNRENGVGYESVLISDELYHNQDLTKFIPIIRRGSVSDSYPRYLGNRKGLFMVEENDFEHNLTELMEDLKNN